MVRDITKLVINLPDRVQRLHNFKQEALYLWPKEDGCFVIPGIRDDRPERGIAKAHHECIKFAKERGLDKVLIMEDDVVFPGKEKTIPYMEEAFKKLPENWDIIIGGVYYLRNEVKVNNYWRRIGEFCALHWYIVNEKAYDKLLTFDYVGHYDRWMGKQGLNIYLPRRFWAIQRDGYSDNAKRETDYNLTRLKQFEILR